MSRLTSLKSPQYVAVTVYAEWDTVDIPQRLHNEVHVWTFLHNEGMDVVPFVGVYSTGTHPFGLVYEYMDGLQYLMDGPNVGRLKLVLAPLHTLPHTSTL